MTLNVHLSFCMTESSSCGTSARFLAMASRIHFLQSFQCLDAVRQFSCGTIWQLSSALHLPRYSSAFEQAFLLRDFFLEFVLWFRFRTTSRYSHPSLIFFNTHVRYRVIVSSLYRILHAPLICTVSNILRRIFLP